MGSPFECDLCHFRNVCQRDPRPEVPQDLLTLVCIRRAILDALWAREPSTVAGNLSRLRRDYREARDTTSMVDLLPAMGNPKVEDRVGMKVAVMSLLASLRDGNNTKNIQWDTVRRTQTWYKSVYDAGVEYDVQAVLAFDSSKATASTCVTMGIWFGRFARGCRLRMGVVRIQNEPLTAPIIHALDRLATQEWMSAKEEATRKELEDTMCFALFGYLNGLRGEEIPLVSLRGMLHFWNAGAQDPEPFIMTTLRGRFKGENDERWHVLPIPDATRSRLPARKWIGKKLRRCRAEGKTTGWLFTDRKGDRAKFGHYDETLRRLLGRVKAECPGVIDKEATPMMFSLWRSMRRGTTLAATGSIGQDIIDLYNRWRKIEGSKGGVPAGLSMQQTYLHVRGAMPQLKQFGTVL